MNITPGSREHDAFHMEYFQGHSGQGRQELDNDYLKNIMSVKLKLIQKDFLDEFRFYSAAKHQCSSSILDVSPGENVEVKESIAEDTFGCKIGFAQAHASGKGNLRRLSLLLDVERFDQDFAHSRAGSSGIDLLALSRGNKPILSGNSINISPGQKSSIRILPTIYETRQYLRSSERGCVIEEERSSAENASNKLYYNSSNICQYCSVLEKTFKDCHCSPKFLDFATNSSHAQNAKCHGQGLICAKGFLKDLGQYSCLPECNRISYNLFASSEPFPVKEHFMKADIFCKIVKKLSVLCSRNSTELILRSYSRNLCPSLKIANSSGQICTGKKSSTNNEAIEAFKQEVYNYSKESLAIVDIQMTEPFVTKFVQKEARTIHIFVFKTFLILCIFLGFNIFGLLEFLFYFLLGCCRCVA